MVIMQKYIIIWSNIKTLLIRRCSHYGIPTVTKCAPIVAFVSFLKQKRFHDFSFFMIIKPLLLKHLN